MKSLPSDLVESLDLIVASPVHPLERQDIKRVKIVGNNSKGYPDFNNVLEELESEDLKELQFFGMYCPDKSFYVGSLGVADLSRLSFYLSRGSPLVKEGRFEGVFGWYDGQYVTGCQLELCKGRKSDSLYCSNTEVHFAPQEIIESENSFASSHGDYDPIAFPTPFEKPILFDPKKEFILVRSPNNSVVIANSLYQTKAEEREKNFKDYALIYASPDELLQGKRWAFNHGLTNDSSGIIEKYNGHLLK